MGLVCCHGLCVSSSPGTFREVLKPREPHRHDPEVMQIFSPPRVTNKAAGYGFRPVAALDKEHGWNAINPAHVADNWDMIVHEDPDLITMSPPCRFMSIMQNLTPEHKRRDLDSNTQGIAVAISFVNLCMEVAAYQVRQGKHYLFQAPR